MAEGRPITFLSDYGYEDEFAGVCRAVIRQIAPDAPLIDLTHGIGAPGDPPRRDRARERASLLPAGGPPRGRRSRGRLRSPRRRRRRRARRGGSSSGPTTACWRRALERLGGAADAVDLARSPFRLEPVSATFHGRDLFAPVAAHLALGRDPGRGRRGDRPGRARRAGAAEPRDRQPSGCVAHALYADRFGNVTLDLDAGDARRRPAPAGRAARASGPPTGASRRSGPRPSPTSAAATCCSTRTPRARMALAVNGGSADGLLDLEPDAEVELRPL